MRQQRGDLRSFFCILFFATLSMMTTMTTTFVEAQSCTIDREGMPNECDPLLEFSYFIPPASYNITRDDITRQATIATLSLSAIDDDCRSVRSVLICSKQNIVRSFVSLSFLFDANSSTVKRKTNKTCKN